MSEAGWVAVAVLLAMPNALLVYVCAQLLSIRKMLEIIVAAEDRP